MRKQGKVVRWEADKGFGFIRSPDTVADVFFHVRDYHGMGAPAVGQSVAYEEIHVGGKGLRAMAVEAIRAPAVPPRPRSSARSARGRQRPRQTSSRDARLWPVLLSALAYGCVLTWMAYRGLLPMAIVLGWPLLNAVTFWFYWRDKYAARQRAWRTPEKTLHALSLLGGWPAAYVAQQLLRHKTIKPSFRLTYWLTVLLNVSGLVLYLCQPDGPSK